MKLKRRMFLQKALAGGALVGGSLGALGGETAGASGKADHFDIGDTVTLGKTGIKLSRVGLGTGMKGWK